MMIVTTEVHSKARPVVNDDNRHGRRLKLTCQFLKTLHKLLKLD